MDAARVRHARRHRDRTKLCERLGLHGRIRISPEGLNGTVVDDLSRGSIETILRLQALAEAAGEPLNWVRLDVNEEHKMVELLTSHNIDTVVHFSGNAYVGESMVYPEAYYQNITVPRSFFFCARTSVPAPMAPPSGPTVGGHREARRAT